MKLTEEQEALIELIASATDRLAVARSRELEIARQQAEARIRAHQIARDKLVALGRRRGIPWSQLAERGLGTRNHKSAKAAAALGQEYLDQEPAAPLAEVAEQADPRFTWAPENRALIVTLEPNDFVGKISGISEQQTQTLVRDGGTLVPVDDDWQHPVIRLLSATQLKSEALEFISRQEG